MIIPARFNGPPTSGNGGYSAGLVASYLDGPAEVTLRKPPPLDTPLDVAIYDSTVEVSLDGSLVASGTTAEVPVEPVPPVTHADAVRASLGYRGFVTHPFPTCFVCGPQREVGDGLRLFPGPLGDGRTAAPWAVPFDISPVLVWAALDCPGGWSVPLEVRTYVLGRLAVRIEALPDPGAACVVMGELRGEEGRKAYAATTLYGPGGEVLAHATATWLSFA